MKPLVMMTVAELQALYTSTATAAVSAPPSERAYLTKLRDDVATRLKSLGQPL